MNLTSASNARIQVPLISVRPEQDDDDDNVEEVEDDNDGADSEDEEDDDGLVDELE